MRIIICTRDIQTGGVGTHVSLLLRELVNSKEIEKILVISPVEIPVLDRKIEVHILPNLGSYFVTKQPNFAIKCPQIIRKKMKNDHFDIIHTHFPIFAKDLTGPLVSTIHFLNAFQFERSRMNIPLSLASTIHKGLEIFDKLTISESKTVIFVSRQTMSFATNRYLSENKKFLHIPNFVDPKSFHPVGNIQKEILREKFGLSLDSKYFLFVGRLEPLKGIHILLEAFKALNRNYSEVRLLIVGDGVLKDYVTRFTFVDYLGKVDHNKLNSIYNLADCYILPSLYENSPMTVLEAMSAGLPVIGTNVGDVREIINDDSMIIFNPNSNEVQKKIDTFLNLSEIIIKNIGEKNRRRIIENYSCEVNIPKILRIYESII